MTHRDIGDFSMHPEAVAEVEAALERYLAYSADSAAKFREELRTRLKDILDWPQLGPPWSDWDHEPPVHSYGRRVRGVSAIP